MKRDLYIMASGNYPFAPCFRAAHTLATPPHFADTIRGALPEIDRPCTKKRTDATTGCRCVGKVGKDGFEPPKA